MQQLRVEGFVPLLKSILRLLCLRFQGRNSRFNRGHESLFELLLRPHLHMQGRNGLVKLLLPLLCPRQVHLQRRVILPKLLAFFVLFGGVPFPCFWTRPLRCRTRPFSQAHQRRCCRAHLACCALGRTPRCVVTDGKSCGFIGRSDKLNPAFCEFSVDTGSTRARLGRSAWRKACGGAVDAGEIVARVVAFVNVFLLKDLCRKFTGSRPNAAGSLSEVVPEV